MQQLEVLSVAALDDGKARLRVDLVVPWRVALRCCALLLDELERERAEAAAAETMGAPEV